MFNAKTFAKYAGISVACFFLSGCVNNMEWVRDSVAIGAGATLGTVATLSVIGAIGALKPIEVKVVK